MATPVIPADAKPIAVWYTNGDGGEDDLFWHHREEATAWAVKHLSQPNCIFRVEFHQADVPCAVLYRYVRDGNGRLVYHPETDGPKCAEPVVQVLDSLPPHHLLGQDHAKVDP